MGCLSGVKSAIQALLEKIDPANRQQSLNTISGLLVWYRDILDAELIAAWQKGDRRDDLAAVMKPLADSNVDCPGHTKPFLDDLLGSIDAPTGPQALALSQSEAEAVCRILLDLPDIRTWKKSALRILPHYRPITEDLLARDLRSNDTDKRNLAEVWLLLLPPLLRP